VFQQFKLVNGTWDVKSVDGRSERVKPGDIKTTRVMTVEGELDDISGSGQTEAALDMCTGVAAAHKKHFEAKGAGHYGIFSGRRWRELVYPEVKAFILAAHTLSNKPLDDSTTKPSAAKKIAITKPAVKAVAQPAEKVTVKPAAKRAPAKAARSK
jgi:poly(3-hydroxybutyrate) depolymerase